MVLTRTLLCKREQRGYQERPRWGDEIAGRQVSGEARWVTPERLRFVVLLNMVSWVWRQ